MRDRETKRQTDRQTDRQAVTKRERKRERGHRLAWSQFPFVLITIPMKYISQKC